MTKWELIYQTASYRQMIKLKTKSIVAMTLFFVCYYFALPLSVGYWPEMMSRPVWGSVNWAYLFAFSQFLMTWAIAYLYMHYAGRFDRMSENILAKLAVSEESEPGQKGI